MAEGRIDGLAGVERERERYQDRGGWPKAAARRTSRRQKILAVSATLCALLAVGCRGGRDPALDTRGTAGSSLSVVSHRSWSTESTLPEGSRNQAMYGPSWRNTPRSS